MKGKLDKISDYFMYAGFVISAYSFYEIYKINKNLPSGVCPIDSNKASLYFAIFLLGTSFLLSITSSIVNQRKKLNTGGENE